MLFALHLLDARILPEGVVCLLSVYFIIVSGCRQYLRCPRVVRRSIARTLFKYRVA